AFAGRRRRGDAGATFGRKLLEYLDRVAGAEFGQRLRDFGIGQLLQAVDGTLRVELANLVAEAARGLRIRHGFSDGRRHNRAMLTGLAGIVTPASVRHPFTLRPYTVSVGEFCALRNSNGFCPKR